MTARDAIARTKIGPLAHVIAEMLERAGEQRPNGDILHDILVQALPAASPPLPAPAGGPVPTRECRLHIGQPVRLANPYPEDDPEAEFYVTGIDWEYRSCPARGWNITIASKYDIEMGYGQTDGFAPDDLLSSRPKGGA